MPSSIRYINQSAPFWDFVASLENQGPAHQTMDVDRAQTPGSSDEEDQAWEHGMGHGPWGGRGNRGFHRGPHPFRGPRGPPGPPPHHAGTPPPPPQHEGPPGPPPPGEGPHTEGFQGFPPPPPSGHGPRGHHGHHGPPPPSESPHSEGFQGFPPPPPPGRGHHGPHGRHGRGSPPPPPHEEGAFGPPPHDGPPHPHHHGHGGKRGGRKGFGGRGGRGSWGAGGFPGFGGPGPFGFGGLAELFQQQLFGDQNSEERSLSDFKPDADVFDTEHSYIVHLSLPGAKKEDVAVSWDAEKSELSIGGVVHRPGDEELLKTLALDERKVGAFDRKIRLGSRANPAQVDDDAITAKLEDGILRVDVPKLDKDYVEIKKVDIE